MADVTAAMVKELRERTQAGMASCKKALVEAGGDMEKAVEILQKMGEVRSAKAAGRVATEGRIVAKVSPDGTRGVLAEVNIQTDFAARNDEFRKFADEVAARALEAGTDDLATLENDTSRGTSLKAQADALTAKIGEKVAARRFTRFVVQGKGLVATYVHHGDRLGVMVEVAGDAGNPKVREFADDVALQVASMGPKYVNKGDVAEADKVKQREIFVAQMKKDEDDAVAERDEWKKRMDEETASGAELSADVHKRLAELSKKVDGIQKRPAAARDKILDGKVDKWLNEIVLNDQPSVKESKKTIGQLLEDLSKSTGSKVTVARFVRYELGEGIEKGPQKDFAQEVAEMAGHH